MPIRNDTSIEVKERLFLRSYMEDGCKSISKTFREVFPDRVENMTDENSVYTAATRLYARLKKSLSFKEMLEINGLDDPSLVHHGKRLLEVKKPFFGPGGEMVYADDGQTQAKVWDKLTELRGHGTGSKQQINITGAGPLKIEFTNGELKDDNVEIGEPESDGDE